MNRKYWYCSFLVHMGCSSLDGEIIASEMFFADQYTTYQINVYLPSNYEAGQESSWMLMLDGDVGFYNAAALLEEEITNGADPIILVGVGQQETRNRDYTPTVTEEENMSGGVEAFFSFLDSDVIPFVEQEYSVGVGREYRSITGHSYGGLATIWALYHRQDVYSGYGATSPAIWWDRAVSFEWEREYAQENEDLAATLYMSMGQLEITPMNPLFTLFVADLSSRSYSSLNFLHEELYGHEHYSSWEPGMRGFIRHMYGGGEGFGWQCCSR